MGSSVVLEAIVGRAVAAGEGIDSEVAGTTAWQSQLEKEEDCNPHRERLER